MKDSSHWYDPTTGEAKHTIIGKNGKERNTTIKDARANGWLPSVTTIFKVLAAPELDRWKQQQVLLASMTLPRNKDESDDDWMARVMEDAFEQVSDAADLGTRVHKALEDHLQGQPYDMTLKGYVEPVDAFLKQNNITFLEHELRLTSTEYGYAGTTDGIIQVAGRNGTGVLDFKTRKSKPEYPMKPYNKEPMQIAAYGYVKKADFGINVFISTTQEGRVECAWYEKEQLDREFQAFTHIIKAWQHFNNYDPTNPLSSS